MPTLVSWNVNGFRSALGKGLVPFVQARAPDVLCLQETKIDADHPAMEHPELAGIYPHRFWHPAIKRGYSGTAIFSREEPKNVIKELPGLTGQPSEGRVVAAEYANFWLVNLYVPNSRRELVRLPYRQQEWDPALREFLTKLARKKPVLACGDFNVAHEPIDLANPGPNRRNAGFTDEEREGFSKLLEAGFEDTFRARHPEQAGHYSWWTYRMNARARNIGWRIDYFLASTKIVAQVEEAFIWPDVHGSDHCPVGIRIKGKL